MKIIKRLLFALLFLAATPITFCLMIYFIFECIVVAGLYWVFTGENIDKYSYFNNEGLFGMHLNLFDWIQNKKDMNINDLKDNECFIKKEYISNLYTLYTLCTKSCSYSFNTLHEAKEEAEKCSLKILDKKEMNISKNDSS